MPVLKSAVVSVYIYSQAFFRGKGLDVKSDGLVVY